MPHAGLKSVSPVGALWSPCQGGPEMAILPCDFPDVDAAVAGLPVPSKVAGVSAARRITLPTRICRQGSLVSRETVGVSNAHALKATGPQMAPNGRDCGASMGSDWREPESASAHLPRSRWVIALARFLPFHLRFRLFQFGPRKAPPYRSTVAGCATLGSRGYSAGPLKKGAGRRRHRNEGRKHHAQVAGWRHDFPERNPMSPSPLSRRIRGCRSG